jgi:hypothetical protein
MSHHTRLPFPTYFIIFVVADCHPLDMAISVRRTSQQAWSRDSHTFTCCLCQENCRSLIGWGNYISIFSSLLVYNYTISVSICFVLTGTASADVSVFALCILHVWTWYGFNILKLSKWVLLYSCKLRKERTVDGSIWSLLDSPHCCELAI